MEPNKFLFYVAIAAVIVSLAGVGFSYYAVQNYRDAWLVGMAVQEGVAKLQIEGVALINFTIDELDWGSGRVNDTASFATLHTSGDGSVTDGNWTTVSPGFAVRNIGNNNLTLNLKTAKNAASFLGGTTPSYQYNVTNIDTGSCTPPGGFDLGTYYNVNTSSPGTRVCDIFQFLSDRDEIRIDIKLVVPDDSLVGSLSDTMTATISAV